MIWNELNWEGGARYPRQVSGKIAKRIQYVLVTLKLLFGDDILHSRLYFSGVLLDVMISKEKSCEF